jgi:hypothetical protein
MTSMPERRRYRRFVAWLPLQLTAVADKIEPTPLSLLTLNISRAGVCFPVPRRIEPGELIAVEVTLSGVGLGGKDVHISNSGRAVRVDASKIPGWYEVAATFDEPPSGDQPAWHKLAAEFEGN